MVSLVVVLLVALVDVTARLLVADSVLTDMLLVPLVDV